jgi:hypothetical protein
MTTTDFPILDAPRTEANNELGRVILDYFGNIEPFIEETDFWVAMPLRLVHDQAGGCHLEIGPYSLDRADIEHLREAIAAYDQATGPQANQAGAGFRPPSLRPVRDDDRPNE